LTTQQSASAASKGRVTCQNVATVGGGHRAKGKNVYCS
jgi:hypothetical protein